MVKWELRRRDFSELEWKSWFGVRVRVRKGIPRPEGGRGSGEIRGVGSGVFRRFLEEAEVGKGVVWRG